MGRVILCETKPSKTSYIFPNTRIEVFSYEELCYYIYNNIALISEEHISHKLFQWIDNGLGLTDLAKNLKEKKGKESTDLTDLLAAILTYKEFYTIPEIKEFLLQVERMKGLSSAQFRKMQADGFLRYRKSLKASSIYDEILDQNPNMKNDKFQASIYHNRAVALAHNFEIDQALESYSKAYEIAGDTQSVYEYLLLLASVKTREDVDIMAKYFGAEDMVDGIYETIQGSEKDVQGSPIYHKMEKAMYNYEKNDLTDFNRRIDNVVEQLKAEFREQTV